MGFTEVIEDAVAQVVANAQLANRATPQASLVEISPEPVPDTQDSQSAAHASPGEDDASTTLTRPLLAGDPQPSSVQASADGSASLAGASEDRPEAAALESLSPFKALVRRSCAFCSSQSTIEKASYNPLEFYADVRLIPVLVSRSIFQILESNPALREPDIRPAYALVSHGVFSHTWSLLPLGTSLATSRTVLRPTSLLQTYGKGIPMADAVISDYSCTWRAQSAHVRHYSDSWASSGSHVAFQICNDYTYEWKAVEFPRGSGVQELYLWRHNIVDGSTSPAGRICSRSPIKSPIDNSELWSLELDVDKIAPHYALLSAFAMKLPSAKAHAWFASKEMEVPPPFPLVNFAFQDEGHVYQRLEKFYGDWEDSRRRHLEADGQNCNTVASSTINLVRVFKREYVDRFLLPPEAIDLLNTEAADYLEAIKSTFGIHN